MNKAEVYTQTGTPEIRSFLVKGTFDDDMLESFVAFHRDCVSKDVKEAFIYIDSPGGSVSTYLSMQALMSSSEIMYHTIAMGHACSAACLLTAMGDFRWALPETLFMFHDASTVVWGKQREIEESHQVNKEWITKVLESFAKETNQPLDFWLEMAYEKKSGDLYFDSQKALEWGLVDYIGVPEISRNAPFSVDLPCSAEDFQAKTMAREERREIFVEQQKKQLTSKKKPVKKTVSKKAVKKTARKTPKKKTTKKT